MSDTQRLTELSEIEAMKKKLFDAASYGHLETLKAENKEVLANIRSKDNETLLWFAVCFRQLEVVKFLLDIEGIIPPHGQNCLTDLLKAANGSISATKNRYQQFDKPSTLVLIDIAILLLRKAAIVGLPYGGEPKDYAQLFQREPQLWNILALGTRVDHFIFLANLGVDVVKPDQYGDFHLKSFYKGLTYYSNFIEKTKITQIFQNMYADTKVAALIQSLPAEEKEAFAAEAKKYGVIAPMNQADHAAVPTPTSLRT